ncbi:MAG: hypothetical protein AVDCRST_MAG73-2532 [uncultured Thermomicrobiales bacterium]|uniref:Uncharacterized protein n=1 Tax=uncultured Thermomicrobiales bacterium TaxID=1645740 RepID=A0A6J4UCS5_9BACT|nr:MAG: hypothetical protein AVDCRST_MAG73-2532 [uncultured Thermomicrobiales bacterium]
MPGATPTRDRSAAGTPASKARAARSGGPSRRSNPRRSTNQPPASRGSGSTAGLKFSSARATSSATAASRTGLGSNTLASGHRPVASRRVWPGRTPRSAASGEARATATRAPGGALRIKGAPSRSGRSNNATRNGKWGTRTQAMGMAPPGWAVGGGQKRGLGKFREGERRSWLTRGAALAFGSPSGPPWRSGAREAGSPAGFYIRTYVLFLQGGKPA